MSENRDTEPSLSEPGGARPASLRIPSWFSLLRWENNADFWSPPQVYLIRTQAARSLNSSGRSFASSASWLRTVLIGISKRAWSVLRRKVG